MADCQQYPLTGPESLINLALLIFYPVTCIRWMWLCRKHGIDGARYFLAYVVGGVASVVATVGTLLLPAPWWQIGPALAGVCYVGIMVPFARLSYRKVEEVQQKMNAPYHHGRQTA